MEFAAQSAFGEIAALLAMAAVAGFIGIILRQPLIVSFIAVGLIAGPSALDLVHSDEQIDLLSELGIAVLLFLVGIKLDIKLIRSLGAVSLMTGLGQVAFTSIFGFLIGLALGIDAITSLYVAVALTFSSTIIIVKLLSDKREIDSLHGQIALGFLIVQDLVVVLAMIVLSAVGIGAGEADGAGSIVLVLLSGLALVALVVLFSRYIANPLTERLAQAPELLVIFAIALAALFAAVGDFVGLGKEVGGLLAGIALASTPYREIISARLAPLRDFLLLFFFVALGATLDLSLLGAQVTASVVFSLFVLIGNPLIVVAIMGAMGYRKRTGFLAGLTVAQISEFSLIFIAMGVSLGHIESDALGLVTMVGLVTIAASTYMITYSQKLYPLFEPMLGIFERNETSRDPGDAANQAPPYRYDIIVFGLGRFGTAIGLRLKKRGVQVLGVDFNPVAVRRWRSLGLIAEYGDAMDPEFVAGLPLKTANWLVSTVTVHPAGLSHEDVRTTLLQIARETGFRGKIAVASLNNADTGGLLASGADVVLEPFQDAADRAVELLSGGEQFERTDIPEIASDTTIIS
jgi:Kef-type K+ transport system membrane component KefB